MPNADEQRYDVALSFAGEDRVYVQQVAAVLRDAGVRLFYDDYSVVETWGENLIDVFEEVYSRRSKYAVLFISRHYIAKPWARHERQSAQARALIEDGAYILPVRLDDSELPGMPATVGFVDGRRYSPTEVADLIRQKVGRSEAAPADVPRLGVPRTQDEVMRLLSVRPRAWEYLLYAGLVWQGLKAVEPKYRDHRLQLMRPGGRVHGNQEAFELLGSRPDALIMSIENLNRTLKPEPQEQALGAPGEPGDPEAIEHLAQVFASSYEYLLDWAAETRSLHVSDELERFRDITSRMPDLAIDDIRAFVDRMVAEMDRLPALLEADDPEPITLELILKLDVGAGIMREHAKEIKRLRRVFRRGWHD